MIYTHHIIHTPDAKSRAEVRDSNGNVVWHIEFTSREDHPLVDEGIMYHLLDMHGLEYWLWEKEIIPDGEVVLHRIEE